MKKELLELRAELHVQGDYFYSSYIDDYCEILEANPLSDNEECPYCGGGCGEMRHRRIRWTSGGITMQCERCEGTWLRKPLNFKSASEKKVLEEVKRIAEMHRDYEATKPSRAKRAENEKGRSTDSHELILNILLGVALFSGIAAIGLLLFRIFV